MSDPRRARDPRKATPQPPPPAPPPPPETINDTTTATAAVESPPAQISTDAVVSTTGTASDEGTDYKLKFCTVCASNNNRSMEAHLRLSVAGYPVISFGTGSLVRLPGPSITQPYVYPFNTTSYEQMHDELNTKDSRLNRANGVLNMLERNRNVKFGPERWQDWPVGNPRLDRFQKDQGSKGTEGGVVDVVITCEERCWDAVVDNLLERGSPLNRPVHVFNVDIKDSHEEALVGGRAILDLANSLNTVANEEREKSGEAGWHNGNGQARSGFDERVPEILGEWQERWPNLPALWTLSWF